MRHSPLIAGRHLPLLIEPRGTGEAGLPALVEWLRNEAARVDHLLHTHGALLLRGFDIDSDAAFARLSSALVPALKAYVGGDSPRRQVLERVYTSSEYPPELEVRLHNELSYGVWWPGRLLFYCDRSAALGGETHIADGREIFARLPAELRDEFERKGVRYMQHLPDTENADGMKSWQDTFATECRGAVEAHCAAAGMQCAWTERGLRTSIVRPAVLRDAQTGKPVWFNQADQWHAGLASVKHAPREDGNDEPLAHATFGDGSEIAVAQLETVREISAQSAVVYPWRKNDVLVLDNVLTMHGRKPYRGERRILVAMG